MKKSRLSKLPAPLKGPRLVDKVLALINEHELTGKQVQERYNVSQVWLRELRADPDRSPQCDTMQYIYEDLTGRPLVSRDA